MSLGVDTALEDADSFRLTGDDFCRLGAAIGSLHRPTLFVQEGGYCLDVIGRNVVNVLSSFGKIWSHSLRSPLLTPQYSARAARNATRPFCGTYSPSELARAVKGGSASSRSGAAVGDQS